MDHAGLQGREECSYATPRLIKERFQPATHPKVEELHLLHYDTGWAYGVTQFAACGADARWSIRVANRLGVKYDIAWALRADDPA
jgi:hypothetical protein